MVREMVGRYRAGQLDEVLPRGRIQPGKDESRWVIPSQLDDRGGVHEVLRKDRKTVVRCTHSRFVEDGFDPGFIRKLTEDL